MNKIGELMPKANNKDAAMNKTYEKITKMENDYLFLLSLVVIGIVILLISPTYTENSGNISVDDSTLTFKYNNDYSSTFYVQLYSGGSDSAYNDNKTLNGTIVLDLTKVSWDNNYTPQNESAKSDADYAKENFIKDISENFDSIKKEVNITYYDENNTEVDVVNYSVNQENIFDNITLESDKLKIDLFKDYPKDYVTEINEGSKIKGPLIAGNATKTNTIKSAKLGIKLYDDNFCYY